MHSAWHLQGCRLAGISAVIRLASPSWAHLCICGLLQLPLSRICVALLHLIRPALLRHACLCMLRLLLLLAECLVHVRMCDLLIVGNCVAELLCLPRLTQVLQACRCWRLLLACGAARLRALRCAGLGCLGLLLAVSCRCCLLGRCVWLPRGFPAHWEYSHPDRARQIPALQLGCIPQGWLAGSDWSASGSSSHADQLRTAPGVGLRVYHMPQTSRGGHLCAQGSCQGPHTCAALDPTKLLFQDALQGLLQCSAVSCMQSMECWGREHGWMHGQHEAFGAWHMRCT